MKDLIKTWLRYAGYGAAGIAVFLLACYPFSGSNGTPTPSFGEYLVSLVATMFLMAIVAVAVSVFPLLGAYVAREKGRSMNEGAWFGLFLGPFGVLVELLLPTVDGKE